MNMARMGVAAGIGEVYKGLYHMMRREIKEAAAQFLGALATFTATEVVELRQFIFYTVITSPAFTSRDEQNSDQMGKKMHS